MAHSAIIKRLSTYLPTFLVWSNDIRLVKALVSAGAEIETCTSDGWTALHIAAGLARTSILAYIVHLGANINTVDDDGDTPLITATALGLYNIVCMLLAGGADPNYVTDVSYFGKNRTDVLSFTPISIDLPS